MNINQPQPIHWCTGKKSELKPHQQRWAVHPEGHEVLLTLVNGKSIKNVAIDPYALRMQAEKFKKGWVWSDSFDSEDDKRKLIEERKAIHEEKSRKFGGQFRSKLDKLTEAIEASTIGGQRPKLSDEQLQKAMTSTAPKKKTK